MRKLSKPIEADTQYVVQDSKKQSITPPFYHHELAQAGMRKLTKEIPGSLEIGTVEAQSAGTFAEAVRCSVARTAGWRHRSATRATLLVSVRVGLLFAQIV